MVYSTPQRQPTSYLFVDGASFRMTVASIAALYWPGEDASEHIDFNLMSTAHSKSFYYDAWPSRKKNETVDDHARREALHNDLMNRVGDSLRWHASEGVTRPRRTRDRDGGQEQKMVDVMIAVDMLRHAQMGNMERVTLFTSDLDFKPLIDALVQMGLEVTLWFQPSITNDELRRSADIQAAFNSQSLRAVMKDEWLTAHQLPNAHRSTLNDARYQLNPAGGHWPDGLEWRLYRSADNAYWQLAYPVGERTGYWDHISSISVAHIGIWLKDMVGRELPQECQQYV